MDTDRARAEEERKIRRLRALADFTCSLLSQQEDITLEEGLRIIQGVKSFALMLFPDKEETFDLIYGARFLRILNERFPWV